MSKRVGIIAFLQESNTFIAERTVRSHYEQDLLLTGETIRSELADAHHEVGGFFEELGRRRIEAVPIFAARAMPFGVMTDETFRSLFELLRIELDKALPLDGLLVAPHGATVSERIADVDGYWLSQVREIVGDRCPIIGTLDPHANLSPAMVAATDALVAYRTNPHVDQRARGIEAAAMMSQTLLGQLRPTQAAAYLPMIINIECQQTDQPPCSELYLTADRMRQRPGIISTSICLGFPYADVAEMGSAVLAVADGSPDLSQYVANELAEIAWNMRAAFCPTLTSIDEALAFVERLTASGALNRPVCLLDMGDNVGGGSPADGTLLAHALQRAHTSNSFACLFDAEAVQLADRHALGEQVELSIGGKSDPRHGPPLQGAFSVVAKSDGRFSEAMPRHGGLRHFDQGRTVVVRSNELTVMITSRRMTPWSLAQLRHCGLNPEQFRVLVAKGVHAPIAAYREVCEHFVRVNTPGVTSADLSTFDYRFRRRPMFPFETEAVWSPATVSTV